jgi:hypothetical protein
LPPGRGDRAPPRKLPLALSPGFPRKPIRARLSFAEGRALHALEEASGLAETCALLPTGSLSTIRWEWDARACALPVFAGAETAPLRDNDPRAIPGLPPQGDPSGPAHPPGGAGSARPQGRLCPYREIAPSGHRPFACPSMIMTCPGLRRIRISGPAERVPVREEKLEGCEARVATLGKEKSIFWSRREEVSRNSPPPWVEKYRSSGAVWRLRMEKFPFSPSGSMRRQGRSRS